MTFLVLIQTGFNSTINIFLKQSASSLGDMSKVVYVQALSSIGEEKSAKIVAEVAQGKYSENEPYLREVAVQGMSASNLNGSYFFVSIHSVKKRYVQVWIK